MNIKFKYEAAVRLTDLATDLGKPIILNVQDDRGNGILSVFDAALVIANDGVGIDNPQSLTKEHHRIEFSQMASIKLLSNTESTELAYYLKPE